MINSKIILYIAVLIFFQLVNPSNNVLAQNRSVHKKPESTITRKHNFNGRSGKSTLSDASKIGYERIKERDNFFKERHNRKTNTRKNNFYNKRRDTFEKKTFNNQREINYSNKKIRTDNYFHIDKSDLCARVLKNRCRTVDDTKRVQTPKIPAWVIRSRRQAHGSQCRPLGYDVEAVVPAWCLPIVVKITYWTA